MPRKIFILFALLALVCGGFWWFTQSQSPPRTSLSAAPYSDTVLLIPGHGGGKEGVTQLASLLGKAGFSPRVVDIGDGSESINVYAAELARQAKESGSVALVGYSQGGLIARAAAALAPGNISRVITVGTPNQGTNIAALGARFTPEACSASCQEMVPGSAFLEGLPVAGEENRWLSLYTSQDEVVRPADSAVLEGALNIDLVEVCPELMLTHGSIVSSKATGELVSNFLKTGSVVSISC